MPDQRSMPSAVGGGVSRASARFFSNNRRQPMAGPSHPGAMGLIASITRDQ